MLTDETFPRFLRRDPALDGGHHRPGFSFGDFWSPADVRPGKYQAEKTIGREMTTVCRSLGEPVGAIVTDSEVRVCYDNLVMAIYDRDSGALTSVRFSLAQAFLETSRYDIRANQETVRLLTRLIQSGSDLAVVVVLDEDGEGRGCLVLSDSAGVSRPIAMAKMDGETDDLLQRWHCISPIGKIDFCVGIRVFSLDLMIFDPASGEATPYRIAQTLDFSLLDRERIRPELVLELAADAFMGVDWV